MSVGADDFKHTRHASSSDLPVERLDDDEYGFGDFAATLARAIMATPSPQGLVLSINGAWGSGKSSLLNFIKRELELLPDDDEPLIVDFNPWWFEGRGDLATQLLAALRSKLLGKNKEAALRIGDLMAQHAEKIGAAAAWATAHPWVAKLVSLVLSLLRRKPLDVPKSKAAVSRALAAGGKRIVVFIDDIDRLSPEEVRDVFRSVKALGDFQNVVYVLAYAHDVVAEALLQTMGVNGAAYLEKIVQAPFALPAVSKEDLRAKLFRELDRLIPASIEGRFDTQRWSSLYFAGLDHFVTKPRDVVRIVNAIGVTYPPMSGETNAVDFISLEVLRVFCPAAHAVIASAPGKFTKSPSEFFGDEKELAAFHRGWIDRMPIEHRAAIKAIVSALFPHVQSLLAGSKWGSGTFENWRRDLRVCSAEVFPFYFAFGSPRHALLKAEIDALTALPDAESVASELVAARSVVRPDGHSKARDLVDRLRDDIAGLTPEAASHLRRAIVQIGDSLLLPEDEGGMFMRVPNRWRLSLLFGELLGRVPLANRAAELRHLVETGNAYALLTDIVDDVAEAKREPSKVPASMHDLDARLADELANLLARRLREVTQEELTGIPELDFVVDRWSKVDPISTIRAKFEPLIASDTGLLALLEQMSRTGRRESGGVVTPTYQLIMKALGIAMDLDAAEPRIARIQAMPSLSARQKAVCERFMRGQRHIRDGEDPDGFRIPDDD